MLGFCGGERRRQTLIRTHKAGKTIIRIIIILLLNVGLSDSPYAAKNLPPTARIRTKENKIYAMMMGMKAIGIRQLFPFFLSSISPYSCWPGLYHEITENEESQVIYHVRRWGETNILILLLTARINKVQRNGIDETHQLIIPVYLRWTKKWKKNCVENHCDWLLSVGNERLWDCGNVLFNDYFQKSILN